MSISIASISNQISGNIFAKLDTKNQGYIEKSSFTSAVNTANQDNNTEDSEKAFKSLDGDSDGKLTKSELSKGIENLLTQLTKSTAPSNTTSPSTIKQNSNDDERVEHYSKGHHHHDHEVGEHKRGGGGITKEQATSLAGSTDTKISGIAKNIVDNFDAIDTNQDGKVNKRELRTFNQKAENNVFAANTLVTSQTPTSPATPSTSTSGTSSPANSGNSAPVTTPSTAGAPTASGSTTTTSAQTSEQGKAAAQASLLKQIGQLIESYGLGATTPKAPSVSIAVTA